MPYSIVEVVLRATDLAKHDNMELFMAEDSVSTESVSLLSTLPNFRVLEPKPNPTIRMGDPVPFSIDVRITSNGKQFGKKAVIKPTRQNGSIFEINANEPKSVGGTDEDPAPMYYFTAGLGLCFMSHVMGYIKVRKFNVRTIELELRANYTTHLGHIDTAGQGIGGAENFETNVIIDSDEPPERIQELVAVCEEACVAHQSMINAIPADLKIFHNGTQI